MDDVIKTTCVRTRISDGKLSNVTKRNSTSEDNSVPKQNTEGKTTYVPILSYKVKTIDASMASNEGKTTNSVTCSNDGKTTDAPMGSSASEGKTTNSQMGSNEGKTTDAPMGNSASEGKTTNSPTRSNGGKTTDAPMGNSASEGKTTNSPTRSNEGKTTDAATRSNERKQTHSPRHSNEGKTTEKPTPRCEECNTYFASQCCVVCTIQMCSACYDFHMTNEFSKHHATVAQLTGLGFRPTSQHTRNRVGKAVSESKYEGKTTDILTKRNEGKTTDISRRKYEGKTSEKPTTRCDECKTYYASRYCVECHKEMCNGCYDFHMTQSCVHNRRVLPSFDDFTRIEGKSTTIRRLQRASTNSNHRNAHQPLYAVSDKQSNSNRKPSMPNDTGGATSRNIDERILLHHHTVCPECRQWFPSLDGLKRHGKLTGHVVGHFPCPKCDRRFITKEALEDHIANTFKH